MPGKRVGRRGRTAQKYSSLDTAVWATMASARCPKDPARRLRKLDREHAAQELRRLLEQATSPEVLRYGPAHQLWKGKIESVLRASPDVTTETLRRFQTLNYYYSGFGSAIAADHPDLKSYVGGQAGEQYVSNWVKDATAIVEVAIYQLEVATHPVMADFEHAVGPDEQRRVTPGGPIFVVHGHADGRKYELVRLLDRTVNVPAIVLHEQANKGGTILEKFERHAQSASFAVVLLTGDDEGRLRAGDKPLAPRGRQNVIFELGVFIGLLGRERVVVLRDPDVEEPSDLSGLMYIPLDDAGAWRTSLLKELTEAGIKVDYSRIP